LFELWFYQVTSEDSKFDFHKRTQKLNECEIVTTKEGELDPIVEKLTKVGCLEQHYKVQDCYFETKDWRKCTKEVKEFQECLNKSKKSQT
jgi:cytochrome c oxidase assembly factor 4